MRKAKKTTTRKRATKSIKPLYKIETREEYTDRQQFIMRQREEKFFQDRYNNATKLLQTAFAETAVCLKHEKQSEYRRAKLRNMLRQNITFIETLLVVTCRKKRDNPTVKMLNGLQKQISKL